MNEHINLRNDIRESMVQYYADYLSLRNNCSTVTDNCKYHFIAGYPVNSAYLDDNEPFFSTTDPYYKQALKELDSIENRYGMSGISTFLENICNLQAMGCINAKNMLQCIHRHSSKYDRQDAFRRYERWIDSQKYTHLEVNEQGDVERRECTRYIAHNEKNSETKPRVEYVKGLRK